MRQWGAPRAHSPVSRCITATNKDLFDVSGIRAGRGPTGGPFLSGAAGLHGGADWTWSVQNRSGLPPPGAALSWAQAGCSHGGCGSSSRSAELPSCAVGTGSIQVRLAPKPPGTGQAACYTWATAGADKSCRQTSLIRFASSGPGALDVRVSAPLRPWPPGNSVANIYIGRPAPIASPYPRRGMEALWKPPNGRRRSAFRVVVHRAAGLVP